MCYNFVSLYGHIRRVTLLGFIVSFCNFLRAFFLAILHSCMIGIDWKSREWVLFIRGVAF